MSNCPPMWHQPKKFQVGPQHFCIVFYFCCSSGNILTLIFSSAPDLRPGAGLKRPMRRLLKKEVSLDTYTWQKKYGHLTSNIMMAAVDERLKRRFSVSASMEEISKIPNQGSQVLKLTTLFTSLSTKVLGI